MITILATKAYKAASVVKKSSQPNKHRPVSHCIHICAHDDLLIFTPYRQEERFEHSQAIPARIEGETWSTCVPARAFVDWLRVTQEKGKAALDQIALTFDPRVQILRIQAGPTRAEFKCIDADEFPA